MQFCHVIAVHEEDGHGCALFVVGLHLALELYLGRGFGQSQE